MTPLEIIPTIVTFVFLLITLSYYLIIFMKKKEAKKEKRFSSITIIIPAHNEEEYLAECIESAIKADFEGKKELIVVDDGSKDKTAEIASRYPVKVIKKAHTGKADSVNTAIASAKGELIAIIDADSCIRKDALIEVIKEVEKENTAAASCVVKVKNRKNPICMWLHIEQIYNSLIRSSLSKTNANIVTPGPLSVYRKKELIEVGGLSKKGFAEDVDISIKLIRKGWRVGFSDNAVAETNMPSDIKGFLRQRTRFARGIIGIIKKHMRLNKHPIDLYTLPLLLFNYIQAVIMGTFIIYQITSGYITYFLSKGVYFNIYVAKFLFEWFSIIGFIRWLSDILLGQTPLTFLAAAGIASTLLSYPLYIYAIMKYDKKLDARHIIPIFFMFPFWLLVMAIYIACIPEYFRKDPDNKWDKN